MKNIISFFPRGALKEAADMFKNLKRVSYSGAGNSSSKAMLLGEIFRDPNSKVNNVLWIVNDSAEQSLVQKAVAMWTDKQVYLYRKMREEERDTFHIYKDYEVEEQRKLVEFVLRFYLKKGAVFVVDLPSLLQNFPNAEALDQWKLKIKHGEEYDSVKLIEDIVSRGYEISDEKVLKKGQYYRVGDGVFIHPINSEAIYRIDQGFNKIESICEVDSEDYSKEKKKRETLDVYPLIFEDETSDLTGILKENDLAIEDEVDITDEFYDAWNKISEESSRKCPYISFVTFNEDTGTHKHLHFLSVVKYRSAYDLANDFRDKLSAKWKVIFFTKNKNDMRGLFADQAIPFNEEINEEKFSHNTVFLIEVQKEDVFPESFQDPEQKILLLTDKDVSLVREEKKILTNRNIFDDFLTGLKAGDYVVHNDHGIARFEGLEKKTVDDITKEYLKLAYAENDKLFVPIDQADKVNKYIGSEETMPKLTRLGSAEWNTLTKRAAKETQVIAKELLKLYAERKAARGVKFKEDNDLQAQFEKTFQYEETPGQIKAIVDVKGDMERPVPMDRLVCGDVGFGKTEVAMRAAFKAVQSGKQAALIAPITILADQHYKSFKKRMDEFHVRVEMLSRFKTHKEQKQIVEKLGKGEVDIVVGTHRLLQADIKFKDLGLLIIDEEQRFGVKQKEVIKNLRKNVDVLTLTATPIPRTLNICLNKIRDITTITTPPFGRLPVTTEVRKYSASLIRDAILKEIRRGGQVYFLHNRVQTIDSFADKLKELVPEAKFIVAHGKLGSGDLEERVMAFKEKKYDVLVSSTIIENGIDLENANTLIVNNADRFGLAQLYQLRGRVGRGKVQAYAYFLYHGQRLKLDAKKRLRAIVEASDLGSGFQIAMKDLEIRGAGDILGANQHGVINVVGVSHFIRMLNKAVEDLKEGRIMEGEEEPADVSIELPLPSYIPDSYIPTAKDKINTYQKLSSANNVGYLKEIEEELIEEYGKAPEEVKNLFKIIVIKILAKQSGIINIKAEPVPMSKEKEIVLMMSKKVKPANIISLLEFNPKWRISGSRLRIDVKELGWIWLDGLKQSLEHLGKIAKHGVR